MYFTGVVLTVMLQVFQLTQLLQVTLVPTARCVIQSHLSLLENKGTGHEIAPNTVADATKIIMLATKIQKLVAKLATKTLWVLYILP